MGQTTGFSRDSWCNWAGSLAAAGRVVWNWVTMVGMQVRAIDLSHTPAEAAATLRVTIESWIVIISQKRMDQAIIIIKNCCSFEESLAICSGGRGRECLKRLCFQFLTFHLSFTSYPTISVFTFQVFVVIIFTFCPVGIHSCYVAYIRSKRAVLSAEDIMQLLWVK